MTGGHALALRVSAELCAVAAGGGTLATLNAVLAPRADLEAAVQPSILNITQHGNTYTHVTKLYMRMHIGY
jgi:hypothetical protein